MVDMPRVTDIPSDEEDIITDINITFCEDHYNEICKHIDPLVATSLILQYTVTERLFYETAYRLRNGYGMPEEMEITDIPEPEQPEVIHINKTIREFAPLCCWLDDEVEGDQIERIKQGKDSTEE